MQTDLIVIRHRAKWHDVKALIKKLTGIDEQDIFVERFMWRNDVGWLVTLYVNGSEVYMQNLKQEVRNVLIVGYNVMYVQVEL